MSEAGTSIASGPLPLLPLRGACLLPGERLRIRGCPRSEALAAVRAATNGGRLAAAALCAGWDEPHLTVAPVAETCGVGRLLSLSERSDGRVDIDLHGIGRARVVEITGTFPRRDVSVEARRDLLCDEIRFREALARLDRLLARLLGAGNDPGAGLRAVGGPLRDLCGRVATLFPCPLPRKQRLLETDDVCGRLELLAGHLARFPRLARLPSRVRQRP